MLESNIAKTEIFEESEHSKGDSTVQVQISKPSLKTKKIKKIEKNAKEKKIGKTEWTQLEKTNFFAAVIQFQITNPRLLVSWANEKPKFYPNIEQIMEKIAGNKTRDEKQIKSKDQNLKNKNYLKGQTPIDLLPLALQEVKKEIQNPKALQNLDRWEKLNQIYNQFTSMRTENIYAYANEYMQRQTQNLQKIRETIKKL